MKKKMLIYWILYKYVLYKHNTIPNSISCHNINSGIGQYSLPFLYFHIVYVIFIIYFIFCVYYIYSVYNILLKNKAKEESSCVPIETTKSGFESLSLT
jgi:hypothetical protein